MLLNSARNKPRRGDGRWDRAGVGPRQVIDTSIT